MGKKKGVFEIAFKMLCFLETKAIAVNIISEILLKYKRLC